jgi:hypothetical protein
MFRRRFKSSYNNVGDGVYAVNKNLRLIPVSEADNTCIAVALVYDRHRSNNEIHRMYNEILDELGDLATVVSRNYVYGKIKDRTGLSIRHISRIINHSKVEEI